VAGQGGYGIACVIGAASVCAAYEHTSCKRQVIDSDPREDGREQAHGPFPTVPGAAAGSPAAL
jgi:hypothetical protein